MNIIKEVLERCAHGDGIKPEFDRYQLAAEVVSMPDALFDGFMAELKNAAMVKDMFNSNRVDLKNGGQGAAAILKGL